MRVLLLYHFFHPDTVISARMFSDLAEDLAAAGHAVTVFTSNRLIRSDAALADTENWKGIEISRFARPAFPQESHAGRVLNSFILQFKWFCAFRRRKGDFDAIILGTDPQFSYLIMPLMHKMAPAAKLIHWCFDLYPEAIMATGNPLLKMLGQICAPFAKWAYKPVHTMIDIGPCMRKRLQKYGHHAKCITATPWALAESQSVPVVAEDMRKKLFGNARLCFLYSGTVGYAHDITPFIRLARLCRQNGLPVAFCFAGYGNCYKEQTADISPEDTNINLAGFADEAELAVRLAAADFHLISLKDGWEGIVVPSKFFGALAMGRPVLFSGSGESEIAGWIREFDLGYMLGDDTPALLKRLLEHPEDIRVLKENAFSTYRKQFSRKAASARINKAICQDDT